MAARSHSSELRGLFLGTSLHLLRGNRSISRFPSGTANVGALPSGISTHGSRAVHGSSILTESAKGIPMNRPLSPNLVLKKPQLSATYSISHRILGASLGTVILLTPILMKFTTVYDA